MRIWERNLRVLFEHNPLKPNAELTGVGLPECLPTYLPKLARNIKRSQKSIFYHCMHVLVTCAVKYMRIISKLLRIMGKIPGNLRIEY